MTRITHISALLLPALFALLVPVSVQASHCAEGFRHGTGDLVDRCVPISQGGGEKLVLPGINIPRISASESSVSNVLDLLFAIAGALAMIYILVGAIRFSTAGGDPQSVAGGRRTVIYALVGLVVTMVAVTITAIVGGEASTIAGQTNPLFGEAGVITKVVKWLQFAVGAASVFGIIYGAIRYITSAGQAQSAQAARNTIIYSLVGLVVALLAGFLVAFVLERIGQ